MKQRTFFDQMALASTVLWFFVYLAGAAESYQPADSAEFLTIAATWGIAHPPGYPLYSLLGSLFVSIFPFPVPFCLAILAALISVGTLFGLFMTISEWLKDKQAAFWTMHLAGTSLHIWKHATHPEVFALLGFFAIWLTYFALRAASSDSPEHIRIRYWIGYTFFAGLASSHHQTIILTTPVGLWLLIQLFWNKRSSLSQKKYVLFVGSICFICGFLPYIHLLLQPHPPFGSWGEFHTISDVWNHFLRKEFGTFQSGIYQADRSVWHHSLNYIITSTDPSQSFQVGLSLFWPIGIVLCFLKDHRSGFSFALIATLVFSGFMFPSLLKMGTRPIDHYVVARFFLLPDIFLLLLSGPTIACLVEMFRKRKKTKIFSAGFATWIAIAGCIQCSYASSKHRNWLERYGRDVLKELPKHALLLEANDESTCFGMTYLQEIKKIRTDVRFICLPHLSRKWYVHQLHERWPEFAYTWNAKKTSSLAIIKRYHELGRPVHATTLYNQPIQTYFAWFPFGLTWKSLPPKKNPPPPHLVEKNLIRRYQKLIPQKPLPNPRSSPWPAHILTRYRHPWNALFTIYTRMKRKEAAKRCQRRINNWSDLSRNKRP